MAVSSTHYFLIRDMFEHHVLPQHGALLELGEANWYGDVNPMAIADDIEKYVADPARRDELIARLTAILQKNEDYCLFDVVKVMYETFFSPSEVQAIDFEGSPTAHRFDLNQPVTLNRRFEVVINHGTAEHIFNIGQFFRTVHDYTVPGGMMIHESPFTGWIDHGFYDLQPTLFYDLADFNGYMVVAMVMTDVTNKRIHQINSRDEIYALVQEKKLFENGNLFTVLRRGDQERPFQIPIQGFYRKSLSKEGMAAWKKLR